MGIGKRRETKKRDQNNIREKKEERQRQDKDKDQDQDQENKDQDQDQDQGQGTTKDTQGHQGTRKFDQGNLIRMK